MTKIVYNACYGGFGLSEAGILRYAEIKGLTLYPERKTPEYLTVYWIVPPSERIEELDGAAFYKASIEERVAHNEAYRNQTIYSRDIPRDDPALAQVVEELGDEANGEYANLRIAEVPSGGQYRIDEYDGFESVQTPDSYDWRIAP